MSHLITSLQAWVAAKVELFHFFRLSFYVGVMEARKRWHYFRDLPDWFVEQWTKYETEMPPDRHTEPGISICRAAKAEWQLRLAQKART